MPKLIDKKPMKRYDFRITQQQIDTLLQLPEYKDMDITAILHSAIDRVICTGDYFTPPRPSVERHISKTDPQKTEQLLSHDPKTVFVFFRENPDKIKYLQYFYRIRKYGFDNKKYDVLSPSDAIRTCIEDVCNGNLNNSPATENDETGYSGSLVDYPGQKGEHMLKWINPILNAIFLNCKIENYCEPFVGSANVFLHLNAPKPCNYYLNDLDTFTYSLLKEVQTNLANFITSVSAMPCNEREYAITSTILFPSDARTKDMEVSDKTVKEKVDTFIDKLTPMQKAVYLFYHNNLSYRNSKTTMEKKDALMVSREYTVSDFAFPVSACVYDEYETRDEKNPQQTVYHVEHNLTNYLNLLKSTHNLNGFSLRLQEAKIYNLDFSKFIKKMLKLPTTLFYIDSPYFYSEDVYRHDTFNHEELAHLVDKIVASNHFFLLSNRLTVSASRKKKKLTNQHAIDMANKLYSMKNKPSNTWKRYYELRLFAKKDDPDSQQVEILISNYPFSGSKEYTDDITEAEVYEAMNMPLPK